MLSLSFITWVTSLDVRERVLAPARNESLREFFANRSS